jgi:23S rRNA pseudouridine2605 synthase
MRPPRGARGGRPQSQRPGELKGRLSLARALSKFGVCSRKQAERMIEAGRVRVGGKVAHWPARRIDPRRDVVSVDGRRVRDETERIVIALNKPVDCITTRSEPGGRRTVYDLIGDVGRWVFPVGRLDRDSSGLLILTNDHRLGERLTNPESHLPKTYHARVLGVPSAEALRALREGVPLDGGLTRRAEVRVLGSARGASTWLEIVLTEGKNRQLRRMCAGVGHEVLDLVRVGIGRLKSLELAPGEWRQLAPHEVEALSGPARR